MTLSKTPPALRHQNQNPMRWTKFCWPLACAAAVGSYKEQPQPKNTFFESSSLGLNEYIPRRRDNDGVLRLVSLDCSENFVSNAEFLSLVDSLNPDIAVFIKFPRSSSDFEATNRVLSERKYTTNWIDNEYLVISKFHVQNIEIFKYREADVTLTVNGKTVHVLAMNLNKLDKAERMNETMELLYRAGAIMSKQEQFIIMGSTGNSKEDDESWQTLKKHALLKDSFDARRWAQPRFTDGFGRPMDHIMVSRTLIPSVLGSYVYHTGISSHLPIVADINMSAFGAVAIGPYNWESFSADLYQLALYWVPLVAAGAILVFILIMVLRCNEKAKGKSVLSTALASGEIVPVMHTPEGVDQGVWDVIEVGPESGEEPRKERMGSYDSAQSNTHSSLYPPPPPQVLRIQTPPQYPPPPYSSSTDEKS